MTAPTCAATYDGSAAALIKGQTLYIPCAAAHGKRAVTLKPIELSIYLVLQRNISSATTQDIHQAIF